MSKYTTEVRFICEQAAGYTESMGFNNVNAIIQTAIPKVFDFDFPVFDESYRNVLCTKILKHYYTREISEETVGLWKLRLEAKLNEIMPYYNKLYQSELISFDPMTNINITTNHKGKKAGDNEHTNSTTINSTVTGKGTTSNTDTRNDIYSDTPQGALTGLDDMQYLTNARKINDNRNETINREEQNSNTGTDTGTNTYTDTDDYLHTVIGKSEGSSYSELLTQYRETFINIDMMVINDLAPLFFGLW